MNKQIIRFNFFNFFHRKLFTHFYSLTRANKVSLENIKKNYYFHFSHRENREMRNICTSMRNEMCVIVIIILFGIFLILMIEISEFMLFLDDSRASLNNFRNFFSIHISLNSNSQRLAKIKMCENEVIFPLFQIINNHHY